jgi:hypothetical protein
MYGFAIDLSTAFTHKLISRQVVIKMNIVIKVGKEDLLLRGAEKDFELCKKIKRRNIKTGKTEHVWMAYNYFSTPESMFQKLLTMKISVSDATNLRELKQYLVNIRNELMGFYNTKFNKQ